MNGLVWFRNNLRTIDNQSLSSATQICEKIIGIYCFDPRHFETTSYGFKKTAQFRTQFLIESIQELRKNLAKQNIPLFVYTDTPENKIPELILNHKITHIFSQKEWTSEEVTVENNIRKLIDHSVSWKTNYDQFLYHPEDIPFEIEKIPNVFTGFRKKLEKYSTIKPLANEISNFTQKRIENTTQIPSISEFGYSIINTPAHTAFPFTGGENSAQKRLTDYLWNTQKLTYYKKTRNELLGTNYSSKFSAWLANGCISPKIIYYEIKKYEQEIVKNDSTYWLIFELIWRDYFKYISLKHHNSIFKINGILHKNYNWSTDKNLITKWVNGETGKTFVDANMIELQQTGWMSNRGRQNVASYFAKELKLDWRIGAAYFESMLIDYDVHSNYGNWMYVAGVGNDPRDRKFNVDLQAQRYDTNGKYQRLWLQPTLF